MKHFSVALIAAAVMCGCASRNEDAQKDRAQISYYDRNSDGMVDLEKHTYRGVADADWELRDDDYSGRYEKKIFYGFVMKESAVDLAVPTGVKLAKTSKGHLAAPAGR